MKLVVSDLIGKGYGNGWFTNCHDRYRCFGGARKSKKSVDILGFEPVLKVISDPIRNVAMVRQNAVDNQQSTFANLVNCIERMGLTRFFAFRSNPLTITYRPTGQIIRFFGFNNPTSLTSLKAQHGLMTDVYFEEASELKNYEDFRKLDGSIRIGTKEMEEYGLVGKPNILQITFVFNPWNKSHWLYDTFFKGRLEDDAAYLETHDFADCEDPEFSLGFGKGLYLHKSTFRINEFRNPEDDENMAIMRERFPEMYKVEGLGMWGNSTDSTYPEFNDSLVITPQEASRQGYIDYAIGIDTGLSNGEGKVVRGENGAERVRSATTMQLVGLTSDCSRLVAVDEYFHSNQGLFGKKTEPQLMEELVAKLREWRDRYAFQGGLMRAPIPVYVDCADIGFRQGLELEARRQGLREARFMPSTKLRIQTRVDFSRLLMAYGDFLFSSSCPNLAREIRNSRKGAKGEVREDFDDHAINACEYAWASMAPKVRLWKSFKPH